MKQIRNLNRTEIHRHQSTPTHFSSPGDLDLWPIGPKVTATTGCHKVFEIRWPEVQFFLSYRVQTLRHLITYSQTQGEGQTNGLAEGGTTILRFTVWAW